MEKLFNLMTVSGNFWPIKPCKFLLRGNSDLAGVADELAINNESCGLCSRWFNGLDAVPWWLWKPFCRQKGTYQANRLKRGWRSSTMMRFFLEWDSDRWWYQSSSKPQRQQSWSCTRTLSSKTTDLDDEERVLDLSKSEVKSLQKERLTLSPMWLLALTQVMSWQL